MGRKENVQFIDIRFTDILGTTHHYTMPLHSVDLEAFTFGIGFDGSSIRGWKAINESDMLNRLDASTAFIDPFLSTRLLSCFLISMTLVLERPTTVILETCLKTLLPI